jgi:four helix bundle protein
LAVRGRLAFEVWGFRSVCRLHNLKLMLKNFEAYQVAKEFYWTCKGLKLPRFLRDQLLRASSSVALNIAEGSGKRTPEDQSRFYSIALGSLRECQGILDLEQIDNPKISALADRLGAMLFKLSRVATAVNRTGTETGTGTATTNAKRLRK